MNFKRYATEREHDRKYGAAAVRLWFLESAGVKGRRLARARAHLRVARGICWLQSVGRPPREPFGDDRYVFWKPGKGAR